jgi:hypothetical protein
VVLLQGLPGDRADYRKVTRLLSDSADRLGYFFSDVTSKMLPGVGHFAPLEAPQAFAAAVPDALATVSGRLAR